jgi:RNA polymerase sigma factor (sigma-70 family)
MSDQPKTRLSLILRLRHADDAAAWQEFVEIYQPLIFRLARSRGLQEADALDMTQEVMARVAKAVNHWDPDPQRGTFRGWISRITRNLVIEFLRSKNRRPVTSSDSSIDQFIQSTPGPSPETELFDLEHQRQVFVWAAEKVRGSFRPKSWQAFWLTAVDNRSADDVANELGMTKGSIYIARSRVMAKLKEKITYHSGFMDSNRPDQSTIRDSAELPFAKGNEQ